MGSHILRDPVCKGTTKICGLCLGTGSSCEIYLKTSRKHGPQIDMDRSRCRNLYKISLKKAAKSTQHSPCTNAPMSCPLCPPKTAAVWKYNLEEHIIDAHLGADPKLYELLYSISTSEEVLMKGVWNKRTTVRVSKKKKNAAARPVLKISEAHSTRVSSRFVYLLGSIILLSVDLSYVR